MKNATFSASDLKALDRDYASSKCKLDEAREDYRNAGSNFDEARYQFNQASRARAFNYLKFYFVSIVKLIRGQND